MLTTLNPCLIGLGAVALALTNAACAPVPDSLDAMHAERACAQLLCERAQGSGCAASTPALELLLSFPVYALELDLPKVAILPWVRQSSPLGCQEDEACAPRGRCVQGRCWSPSRSQTQLRRWFRGEAGLEGARPGWRVHQRDPQTLRLETDLAAEEDGLWGIYAGPAWVTEQGHPLGASLKPLALIAMRGHGHAVWSKVQPRVRLGGKLEIEVPAGWSVAPSWQWSGRCVPGGQIQLGPCRMEAGVCHLEAPALGGWPHGACRIFVKLPGQAAYASAWFEGAPKAS